jgi:hypothetical protein
MEDNCAVTDMGGDLCESHCTPELVKFGAKERAGGMIAIKAGASGVLI